MSNQLSTFNDLTVDESSALRRFEAVVQTGLRTFCEVGDALAAIRDGKLYRAEYSTFEGYCRTRFSMTPQHAGRLMRASEVFGNIEPIGSVFPASEGQLRPLSALPPDYQRLAWQNAQRAADLIEPGSAPTASVIQASVEAVQEIISTGGYVSIGGDSVAADRPLGDEHAGLLAATVDAIRERQLRSAQHRADGSRHLLTLPIALSDDGLIDIAEITFPPGALEAVRRLLRDQDCEFVLTVKRLAPNPVTQGN